ncbi:MAG: helix-turn-helix transcriptional regulator [Dehalococcoidia bacterium]|nr:helix-turn-helix transcriptional regulator [Dehalococcoidia bacterium]
MTMTAPARPPTPPSGISPQLTPRQREVLDLLAKRRTNPQIAEALGISLDGAKWHVSEIIGVLGVDSREEAADWWREYNGLPSRLRRWAAGIFAGGAGWRWAATGGIAAAAVAFAAVAYAIYASLGADEEAASGDLPATPTVVTEQPTAPAGGGAATPTVTAAPGGPVVGGVASQPLTVGDPAELPRGITSYYAIMGYATEGDGNSLRRAYRDSAGQLRTRELFAPLQQYGRVYDWTADFDRGLVYAAVCTQGYCGNYATPSADAQARVFASTDGGVTWTDSPPVAFGSFFMDVTPHGVIVREFNAGTQEVRHYLYPSGTELAPPAGVSANMTPEYIEGLGMYWKTEDARFLLSNGEEVIAAFTGWDDGHPNYRHILTGFRNGDLLVVWSTFANKPYDEQPFDVFYAAVDRAGNVKRSVHYPGDADIRLDDVLTDSFVLGNVLDRSGTRSVLGEDMEVALIDLETGGVHPILELSAGMTGGNSHPFTMGATTGNVLEVTGAGDCLNVRDQASAGGAVLDCYADGVLLVDRDEQRADGGVTWLAVRTPDGRAGWASAEFLSQ